MTTSIFTAATSFASSITDELFPCYGVNLNTKQMMSQDLLQSIGYEQLYEQQYASGLLGIDIQNNSFSNNYILFSVVDGNNYYSDADQFIIAAIAPELDLSLELNSTYTRPFSQFVQKAVANAIGEQWEGALELTGQTLFNPYSELPVWKGIDVPKIVLDVLFVAIDDPVKEVDKAVTLLYSLLVPTYDNTHGTFTAPIYNIPQANVANFLESVGTSASTIVENVSNTFSNKISGSTITNQITSAASSVAQQVNGVQQNAYNTLLSSKNSLSVYIGNFITIPNAIVTNVSMKVHNRVNINGTTKTIGHVYARGTVTIEPVTAPFKANNATSSGVFMNFNALKLFYKNSSTNNIVNL